MSLRFSSQSISPFSPTVNRRLTSASIWSEAGTYGVLNFSWRFFVCTLPVMVMEPSVLTLSPSVKGVVVPPTILVLLK